KWRGAALRSHAALHFIPKAAAMAAPVSGTQVSKGVPPCRARALLYMAAEGYHGGRVNDTRAIVAVVIALAAFVARAPLAHADDPPPPQGQPLDSMERSWMNVGISWFKEKNYDEALRAFQEGYAIHQHPDFLYAIAQAHRLRGDCESARRAYEQFLAGNPP